MAHDPDDKSCGDDDLPPPGFDPLRASQEDLARYGLPPRPDPLAQPLLYRAFATVFSPPLDFVAPGIEDVEFIGEQVPQPATPIGTPSPTELSTNWSGAYIEANQSRMFVQIVARWSVPVLALPPPIGRVPPDPATIYDSSTWIWARRAAALP